MRGKSTSGKTAGSSAPLPTWVKVQPGPKGVMLVTSLGKVSVDVNELGVDLELDGVHPGVVVPDRLDRAAVAGAPRIGDDNPIAGLLLGADAGESNSYGHASS